MEKHNQRGIIHMLPLILILIGIVAGVYLIQKNGLTYKSKASQSEICSALSIKDKYGKDLECDCGQTPPVCKTKSLDINIRVKYKTSLTPNEALPLNDAPATGDSGGNE